MTKDEFDAAVHLLIHSTMPDDCERDAFCRVLVATTQCVKDLLDIPDECDVTTDEISKFLFNLNPAKRPLLKELAEDVKRVRVQ